LFKKLFQQEIPAKCYHFRMKAEKNNDFQINRDENEKMQSFSVKRWAALASFTLPFV